MEGRDIMKVQRQSPGTLLYFHPTSSVHESFLLVCLEHFSSKSTHCIKGKPQLRHGDGIKSLILGETYKCPYLVLQGFPTTKTFTFREATALSAFPWHNSKFQIITRIQLLCRFFVRFTQIYTWFLLYSNLYLVSGFGNLQVLCLGILQIWEWSVRNAYWHPFLRGFLTISWHSTWEETWNRVQKKPGQQRFGHWYPATQLAPCRDLGA